MDQQTMRSALLDRFRGVHLKSQLLGIKSKFITSNNDTDIELFWQFFGVTRWPRSLRQFLLQMIQPSHLILKQCYHNTTHTWCYYTNTMPSKKTNKMERHSNMSDILQKSSNSKRTSESWITFRDQFKLVFSCSNKTAEVLPLDIDLCQQLSDIINVSRQTTDTVVDLCHWQLHQVHVSLKLLKHYKQLTRAKSHRTSNYDNYENYILKMQVWSCGTAFQLKCDKLILAFND